MSNEHVNQRLSQEQRNLVANKLDGLIAPLLRPHGGCQHHHQATPGGEQRVDAAGPAGAHQTPRPESISASPIASSTDISVMKYSKGVILTARAVGTHLTVTSAIDARPCVSGKCS